MPGFITYYPLITSGQVYTIPDDAFRVHLTPSTGLLAATIIMPLNPNSEQTYEINIHQAITVLTWQVNTGQTGFINAPPVLTVAGSGFTFQYRLADKNWYRCS